LNPTDADNPFCTRRVRPGAIPFIFPTDQNVDSLIERLRQSGWRGQIIGPHGSGKSALLAALTPALERPITITLHDGQRRLPLDLRRDPRLHPPVVLIVDGYEQLSYWSRWRLKQCCRRRRLGLLVTTHRRAGLPTLYQTAATPELARQIVADLLGDRDWPFTTDEVSQCLRRHGGNLREMLFDLYDLYQQTGKT
jgi:hypothetical protein